MKISMTANGKPVSAEVEARTLLLDLIREQLRLSAPTELIDLRGIEELSGIAVAGISVPAGNLNSDLHASAEYRSHLITVMARRAVAGVPGRDA